MEIASTKYLIREWGCDDDDDNDNDDDDGKKDWTHSQPWRIF